MTDAEAVELMLRGCRTNFDKYPLAYENLAQDMKLALTALKAAGWQHVPKKAPEITKTSYTFDLTDDVGIEQFVSKLVPPAP